MPETNDPPRARTTSAPACQVPDESSWRLRRGVGSLLRVVPLLAFGLGCVVLTARTARSQDEVKNFRKPILMVETGGHHAPVRSLIWQNGSTLLSGGEDKVVKVWDFQTGPRLVRSLRPPIWRGPRGQDPRSGHHQAGRPGPVISRRRRVWRREPPRRPDDLPCAGACAGPGRRRTNSYGRRGEAAARAPRRSAPAARAPRFRLVPGVRSERTRTRVGKHRQDRDPLGRAGLPAAHRSSRSYRRRPGLGLQPRRTESGNHRR